MVGTTMLAIAGISAAGQALGAWNSSRAAKKAGKQQAEGAQQAAGAVRDAYGTQMGLLDPYAALGRQSANTLGRLMQPGVGYSPEMQASDAQAFQAAPRQYSDPTLGGLYGAGGNAVPRGTPATPPPFMPFAGSGGPPMLPPPSRIPGARYGRRNLGQLMPRRAA